MANVLNFNNIKKRYLTVILPDEKQTTLMIGTPTKALTSDINLIQTNFEKMNSDNGDADTFNELYSACAKVMSRNKAGIKITKKQLEIIFDLEDILIFFTSYVNFISELANQKN
jgi:hypothetical protein